MTTFAGHLLTGTHASRPAATAVPAGTLYSCTDHALVYQSNGTAWATYATLGTAGAIAATILDAKGDLVAASAADTAGKLSVGSNNQVLTADSAQTLGVKWATPAAAGSVAADTLWDAKGDLAVASAADTAAKLTVGSNDQVLTADSAQTLGVKWATPASGAAGALTLLSTTTLGSAGSFDVTGISGAYNDLVCVLIGRGSQSSNYSRAEWVFNNDAGTNYNIVRLRALGSATNVAESLSSNYGLTGELPGNTATAGHFGVAELVLFGYASTTWKKTAFFQNFYTPAGASGDVYWYDGGFYWNSTAAVNRITVKTTSGSTFVTGSQLRIYGRL